MTLALYGKSRRRQWMLVALALFALMGAVSGAFAVLLPANATVASVPLHSSHVGVQNSTFETGSCPTPPAGQEGWWGWHFLMPASNFTSLSVTFQTAGNFSADPFPGGVFIAHPHNSHAYIWTPTDDTLTAGTATSDGTNSFFNLSHVCPGTPTGNIIVGKVIDPSAGVAPADSTTFSGTIVGTGVNKTWSGVGFGLFSAPIAVTAGVQLTVDENSPTNGWTEVAWKAGSLNGTTPVCPADKASYVPGSNIGVNLLAGQTQVLCVMNTKQAETPTRVLQVCKHVETDSAAGGVFTIEVENQVNFVTTNLAPAPGDDDDCTTYSVEDGAEITITETGFPAGWTSSTGYPLVDATGISSTNSNTITVTVGLGTCTDEEESSQSSALVQGLVAVDCTVTFYNKTDGQTESRGLILVEKYIEIDGNLATTLPGEGLVAGWTVTVDGTSKQTTLPAVTFEATVGETVAVSETTQTGYNVLGHSINGGGLLGGSSTNVQVTEGTTLVRFYNQPLGSLTVNKVAVTSHNGSPDVPSPQDRDGWLITVSSALCGYTDTQPTGVNGNVTFTGLPKCTDYIVSENISNPQSPNFVPVGASSVSSVTPSGQTITFTNRRTTLDILIITPTPVIPTPTATTPPPTAPPTNTPVPPTPTPEPEEATEGERTPGPTPIAPSTGTGGSGGSANINILLLVAGLAVLSGGLSLTVAGKRRRS